MGYVYRCLFSKTEYFNLWLPINIISSKKNYVHIENEHNNNHHDSICAIDTFIFLYEILKTIFSKYLF